jgi:Flp pilus assembly pilin Flp
MKSMLKKFWNDEAGFVVTVEMILVATVLVIGLVSGLALVRDAVLAELSDTAQAFGAVDQSFGVSGANYAAGVGASSAQMGFLDAPDVIDGVNEGIGLGVTDGLAVVVSTKVADASAESFDNP